jgi:hypothetical protein
MKLPLVLFATATLLLHSGCVTGRRNLTLDVPQATVTAPTHGKVYIAAITDDRMFQNKPSDPSIPSIDGDVTMLSPEGKNRMIGRQRGGFGNAAGDIALADNDTVTHRVRLLAEEGFRRGGYEIAATPEGATPVTISVDKFWAWMTPGFWALTFEARIAAKVTVKTATTTTSFTVLGYGSNHGQVAKDGNWQEAYEPAFQDFLANFKAEIAKVDLH